MADTKLSEIKRPEDLSSKGLGLVILHSIKFVEAKNRRETITEQVSRRFAVRATPQIAPIHAESQKLVSCQGDIICCIVNVST